MSCCKIDLGSVPHIGPAETDLLAEWSGEYRFILHFLGSRMERRKSFTLGEPLNIPGPFNEDAAYTVNIFDPVGEPVGTLVDTTECFDFFFRTFIAVVEDCYKPECDELDSSSPYPYS